MDCPVLARELDDGRLEFLDLVPDQRGEALNGAALLPPFTSSEEFARLGFGGTWEVFADGLLSCWVPQGGAAAGQFKLTQAQDSALAAWARALRPRGREDLSSPN
jgi:hypothetical protein